MTELVKLYTGLKQVIWVVARTSRHMDWHEVPEGEGGKAGVAVWHEIIDEASSSSELPTELAGGKSPSLITVDQNVADGHEIVEISQDVSRCIEFLRNMLSLRRALSQPSALSLLFFHGRTHQLQHII